MSRLANKQMSPEAKFRYETSNSVHTLLTDTIGECKCRTIRQTTAVGHHSEATGVRWQEQRREGRLQQGFIFWFLQEDDDLLQPIVEEIAPEALVKLRPTCIVPFVVELNHQMDGDCRSISAAPSGEHSLSLQHQAARRWVIGLPTTVSKQ
jgi:hypothetical protein